MRAAAAFLCRFAHHYHAYSRHTTVAAQLHVVSTAASLGCLLLQGPQTGRRDPGCPRHRYQIQISVAFFPHHTRRGPQQVQATCAIGTTNEIGHGWAKSWRDQRRHSSMCSWKRSVPSYMESTDEPSITRASHTRPTRRRCPTWQASQRCSSPSHLHASQAPKEGYRSTVTQLAHRSLRNMPRQYLHRA